MSPYRVPYRRKPNPIDRLPFIFGIIGGIFLAFSDRFGVLLAALAHDVSILWATFTLWINS